MRSSIAYGKYNSIILTKEGIFSLVNEYGQPCLGPNFHQRYSLEEINIENVLSFIIEGRSIGLTKEGSFRYNEVNHKKNIIDSREIIEYEYLKNLINNGLCYFHQCYIENVYSLDKIRPQLIIFTTNMVVGSRLIDGIEYILYTLQKGYDPLFIEDEKFLKNYFINHIQYDYYNEWLNESEARKYESENAKLIYQNESLRYIKEYMTLEILASLSKLHLVKIYNERGNINELVDHEWEWHNWKEIEDLFKYKYLEDILYQIRKRKKLSISPIIIWDDISQLNIK
jgi:hypothetical protein